MNLKSAAIVASTYLDHDIPFMLWGAPGVGKSSLVRQLADQRGVKVIDFRASTRDAVALMGLPDLHGDTTKWKVPDEFPQVDRDGPEGLLFLDEINAAAPSMQAAMFGLVLDRRVGDYTLPPGWRVIAAGNRQSDKAAAQRMPSALANRFAHVDIEPELDASVDHFYSIGVDPRLIAFLRFRPGLLHMMDGQDLRAFPTPRSWESVSKVLNIDDHLRLQAVSGIVGPGPAGELEGFLRVYLTLPSIDRILRSPESTEVPTETSARFALSAALARKVDASTIEPAYIYMKRLPREFQIMFMVDAVRHTNSLTSTKTFIEWCAANRDVTIGA